MIAVREGPRANRALIVFALPLFLAFAGCGPDEATGPLLAPAPVVTGLSPEATPRGSGAVPLTVSGSGFHPESLVQLGTYLLATTFVSTEELRTTLPARLIDFLGVVDIAVFTPSPGGALSAPLPFTVFASPAPVFTSISPESATQGSTGVTLTAVGTNFLPDSRLVWDSHILPSTFVNATEVTATVPNVFLETPGTVTIRVQNPGHGGGFSNSLPFEVVAHP